VNLFLSSSSFSTIPQAKVAPATTINDRQSRFVSSRELLNCASHHKFIFFSAPLLIRQAAVDAKTSPATMRNTFERLISLSAKAFEIFEAFNAFVFASSHSLVDLYLSTSARLFVCLVL
jgi:hypothetical protein